MPRAEKEESGSSHVREHNIQNGKILLVELQAFENQGVSIWLDGYPSNSEEVTQVMNLKEQISYMRDYVFAEGKISQIHFDRVDCE